MMERAFVYELVLFLKKPSSLASTNRYALANSFSRTSLLLLVRVKLSKRSYKPES